MKSASALLLGSLVLSAACADSGHNEEASNAVTPADGDVVDNIAYSKVPVAEDGRFAVMKQCSTASSCRIVRHGLRDGQEIEVAQVDPQASVGASGSVFFFQSGRTVTLRDWDLTSINRTVTADREPDPSFPPKIVVPEMGDRALLLWWNTLEVPLSVSLQSADPPVPILEFGGNSYLNEKTSPDRRYALFRNGGTKFLVVDVVSGTVRSQANIPEVNDFIGHGAEKWDFDGRSTLFDGSHGILSVDAVAGSARFFTHEGADIQGTHEDTVWYTVGRDIFSSRRDGSGPKLLAHDVRGGGTAVWLSESGRSLAFQGRDGIYAMPSDGSAPPSFVRHIMGGISKVASGTAGHLNVVSS